jgi:hypothetical protein
MIKSEDCLSIPKKENFVYAAPGHHLLKKCFFTPYDSMPEQVRVLLFPDTSEGWLPHGKR